MPPSDFGVLDNAQAITITRYSSYKIKLVLRASLKYTLN